MIDGANLSIAVSSDVAIAVRFKKVSTVMPDDTWAKPLVGNDAGQPST